MVSWYLCSWVWYTSLCACNATFSYWMGCIWLSQSCSAASFSLMAEANFQTSRGNTVATTHSINGLRYMPFNCASAIIVFNIPNRFWHINAHKTFSQIWNITSSFWLKKVFCIWTTDAKHILHVKRELTSDFIRLSISYENQDIH